MKLAYKNSPSGWAGQNDTNCEEEKEGRGENKNWNMYRITGQFTPAGIRTKLDSKTREELKRGLKHIADSVKLETSAPFSSFTFYAWIWSYIFPPTFSMPIEENYQK